MIFSQRLEDFGDKLDFGARAERNQGDPEGAAGVRARRIKQWTFYKRDESKIKKAKQTIMDRI